MSGGRLVVLDRSGRDVKRYELSSGLATIGSDPSCDIRVMLPSVDKHHATVVVHAAQTVVRNVGSGSTLVNGRMVSVAALRHGDVITLGDRSMRWEYHQPTGRRQPGSGGRSSGGVWAGGAGWAGGARAGGRRRASGPPAHAPRDRHTQLALELKHRTSMPGSTGGKQVAIVQPQRRDTSENIDKSPGVQQQTSKRRGKSEVESPLAEVASDRSKRSASRSPASASQWSHAGNSTRNSKSLTLLPAKNLRRSLTVKKSTPLRMTVLRKAQSAQKAKVIKIEAPLKIDHTKQAAIMLMTGHTPKSKMSPNKQKKTPSFVAKKTSPGKKTPRQKARPSSRGDRQSRGTDRTVTILEITDDTRNSTIRSSTASTRSGKSSPAASEPRRSALRDRSNRRDRKTESIKFDLSNLSKHGADEGGESVESVSDDDITLRYSESPSPRARTARDSAFRTRTLSPRASALDGRTRTLSPRTSGLSPGAGPRSSRTRIGESYSVVDLVSLESADASRSVYGSADSDASGYGTPASGRRARSSALEPVLVGSSTPYAPRAAASRASPASPATPATPATPAHSHVSLDTTRRSRRHATRSRLTEHDSPPDPEAEECSRKTSRRARASAAGTRTPEGAAPAAQAATPVLCIARLLDTSGARRRPASSPPALPAAPRPAPPAAACDVTPRGSLPLTPDAVKNKHSTAKRPQSKRSIIDDLDRSDVVKQLFSSPVKRKLSRSMTEFSRRELPDDEDFGRPVELVDRSTLGPSEMSVAVSPERFVSPLTSDESSVVKSVRRVFAREAADDLLRVSGVRELFRSRRSPVARSPIAVKRLFARSPRNDLTDVRGVKRLLRRNSPRNDLTNVRGVKKLLRRNSPRNDLSDVRGVRRVMRNDSPRNDLSDVRGVRRLLRRNSPENDLTDVRGVKRVLRKNSPENSLGSVSGVGHMFEALDQSAEAQFDRLVGAPPAHATYSRRAPLHSTPVRAAVRPDAGVSPIQTRSPLRPETPSSEVPEPKSKRLTRGRRPPVVKAEPSPRPTRRAASRRSRPSLVVGKKPPALSPQPAPRTRTRANKQPNAPRDEEKLESQRESRKRGRQPKVDAVNTEIDSESRNEEIEEKPKRGRGRGARTQVAAQRTHTVDESPAANQKKKRDTRRIKRDTEQSERDQPSEQSAVVPARSTRKRKVAVKDDVPSKVAKTVPSPEEEPKRQTRTRAKKNEVIDDDKNTKTSTTGRRSKKTEPKLAEIENVTKVTRTRGRKVEESKENIPEKNNKRKPNDNNSAAKVTKLQAPAKKTRTNDATPVVTRTRSTRAKTQQAVETVKATSSRSRRR